MPAATLPSSATPAAAKAPLSLEAARSSSRGLANDFRSSARGVARPRAFTTAPSVTRDVAASASADPPISARYQAFAASYAAELQSLGAPGGSVAIMEHGEITFAHGFGTKGPNSTAPVDAKTLFRAGSMGKALAAAAYLSLADEGKASVDEKVTAAVPGVALRGDDTERLTMHNLLSQSSGLFDFTNFSLDPALSSGACGTAPGVLQSFVTGKAFEAAEYFMAPPGALWNYSNPNYTLVGAAIEHASGAPFTETMARQIFHPLGMNRTFYLPSQVIADGDYTDGLSTNDDGSPWDVTPDAYDCAWIRPAGYEFTSAIDYAKFMQFLYAGNDAVLSDARRVAMQTPQANTHTFGNMNQYGYGLFLVGGTYTEAGFYRGKVVQHAGGIAGFASVFYMVPETGFGIVMLTNADDIQAEDSLNLAFQSFSGLPLQANIPVSTQPNPAAYPSYAGTYLDPSGIFGEIVVSDVNGVVTLDYPSLDAEGISYLAQPYPSYANEFFTTIDAPDTSPIAELDLAGLVLTFVADESGTYRWLLLQNGIIAERTSGIVTP